MELVILGPTNLEKKSTSKVLLRMQNLLTKYLKEYPKRFYIKKMKNKMKHLHTFESFLNEVATPRFLKSAGQNLARQVKGKKNYTVDQLKDRLLSTPVARMLSDDEILIVLDHAKEELGMNEARVEESVKDGVVTCDKCGWHWDLAQGGDDPYTCHKCGNDAEETKRKRNQSLTGQKRTEETKTKQSLSSVKSEQAREVDVFAYETNEYVGRYYAISEACRQLGFHYLNGKATQVAKGKRNHVKGYVFKYVE